MRLLIEILLVAAFMSFVIVKGPHCDSSAHLPEASFVGGMLVKGCR
jgi:hypothetical protein